MEYIGVPIYIYIYIYNMRAASKGHYSHNGYKCKLHLKVPGWDERIPPNKNYKKKQYCDILTNWLYNHSFFIRNFVKKN